MQLQERNVNSECIQLDITASLTSMEECRVIQEPGTTAREDLVLAKMTSVQDKSLLSASVLPMSVDTSGGR